jgi:phosphatidylglycerophosphatase C
VTPQPSPADGLPDEPTLQVAAWDFDGTITQRDTLIGFLVFFAGRRALSAAAARRVLALGRGLRDDASRDLAKERVIGDLAAGRPIEEIEEAGRRYAVQLPRQFRAQALERIDWHRQEGHTQVMVSASMVYYLRPLATDLGFADVIGEELAREQYVRCTGSFTHPNVRADQKAIRLREWLANRGAPDGDHEIWAYGNSSGDDALLAMADHPTWVGRRAARA